MKRSDVVEDALREANALASRSDAAGALTVLRRLPLDDFADLVLEAPEDYPDLATLLPRMPPDQVQINWAGNYGRALLAQSLGFVRVISQAFEHATSRPLNSATVLDYGCGWGRHLRLMSAFIPPERLYGVDPWDQSIDLCRQYGVHARLEVSDYVPRSPPFGSIPFDLVYAFSVFTHLSKKTTHQVQKTIRSRIHPDGLAVITIRPVEYWRAHREALPFGETIESLIRTHEESGFAFAPHNRLPIDGDITYGDTSISLDYISQEWSGWVIEGVETLPVDPYQTIVLLRPR
ncbi:MAG TPA: class I SAM-dependent methyltransferase [Terriglobia bacterium]|nr:class I SAM-dependent methyltransferase [Terriglobia bacterium]